MRIRRIPIQTPHGRFLPLIGRPGGREDEKGVLLPPAVPPDISGGDGDVGPIDSTDNVGLPWGVQSVDPTTGNEPAGYVLGTTGAGGSIWGPVPSGGGFSTYRDCTLGRSGLYAFWPYDDTSGNPVDLVASYQMSPTVDSPYPTYSQAGPFTDQPDTAILFGGTSGVGGNHARMTYSGTSFNDLFRNLHAYSIEMWIYPTVNQAARLFEMWNGTIGQSIFIDRSAATYLSCTRASDGAIGGIAGFETALNAWTHVRVTFDGTTLNLYLNGVLAGTDTSSVNLTSSSDLTVGNNTSTGSGIWTPFNGRIADFALYTSAVSDFCPVVSPTGPIVTDAAVDKVPTSDGAGSSTWEYPTIEVEGNRYNTVDLAPELAATDNLDDSVTIGFAADMATQAELDAHTADTSAAHAASAISVLDTAGLITATDVEGALAELVPLNATYIWMPLTSTVAGVDVLVFDADHGLIPTLIPVP